ncbi:MAG: nucleotide pyrophosphohydrolase [archaeon GB-1867-005]|nr:nucleotide pyrophosphohydrolase [Candidatus Culexmicrobium cathedralense]
MKSRGLTFGEAQRIVDEWIRELGGGYWPPLSMLAALVEEIGELARELNALEGPKRRKEGEVGVDFELELADIIFAVICIANYYGVNLEDAFWKVITKYTERDVDRWRLRN